MANSSVSCEDILPNVESEILLPILDGLESVAKGTITKSLRGKYVVAYSAGIDSSILAKFAADIEGEATLLTLGRESCTDILRVERDSTANSEKFRLVIKKITASDIEKAAVEVSGMVSVLSLSHFEDCVSFWLAASAAKEIPGLEYIFSANGPDELFCGYDRFRRLVDESGYAETEGEISRALNSATQLQRQVGEIVSKFGYATVEPFLEERFKDLALRIPIEYKILRGNDLVRKRIWRCLGRSMGLPDSTVLRRKKAMQYGMGIHPIVLSLVKKRKIDIKSSSKEGT